nr:hypothetical protein Q903MT_gene1760 [Picea sitchensis]
MKTFTVSNRSAYYEVYTRKSFQCLLLYEDFFPRSPYLWSIEQLKVPLPLVEHFVPGVYFVT